MSLQIWLPFVRNTENQGLALSATSNCTRNAYASTTAGKLGGAYGGYAVYHLTSDFLGNQWSVATWFSSSSFGANNNIIFCKNVSASTDCQIYWSIVSNNQFNIGVNGPSSTANYSYTFATTTWYHLATTYDGTTIKMYINGELVKTATCTTAKPADRLNVGIGCRSANAAGTSTTGSWSAKYNDFRLYDHALSAKEVRELAKGLVLHYKLDDGYVEGTTNQVTTVDGLSNTCYNGATNKHSYGANTDMYKTQATLEGRTGTKVYMGTDGLNAYPYVYFDNFNPVGTGIKTLSFDYYPTIQDSLVPYSYNGAYNWVCYVNGTKFTITNSSQKLLTGIKLRQWNHIEITATKYNTSDTNRGTGYVRIGSAKHTSDTSNFWFFANVQVEEKDHATPYVGGPGLTRTPTTVYDSSGFGYNGTPANVETLSGSPRYLKSTHFTGSTSKIHIPNLLTSGFSTTYTFAWWGKTNSWSVKMFWGFSDGTRLNLYNGIYWNTGDGSRDPIYVPGTTTIITAPSLNVWHHYAMVRDNNICLLYLDGDLYGQAKTVKNIKGTSIYLNGWDSGGNYTLNDMSMIDFRVYSTALSADDILELYHTSASIDKSGSIYARELVE